MSEFRDRARELMAERGMSTRGLARVTYYDKGYLSKVLSGVKPASRAVAAKIDKALGADGELTALASVAPPAAPIDGHDRTPATGADVEQMRTTLGHIQALDGVFGGLHGGGEIADLALRSFRHAQTLLTDGFYLPAVERDLEAVTAELGEESGWLLFDAARYGEARAVNAEALILARIASDRGTERLILSNQALADVHTGRHRAALRVTRAVSSEAPPRHVRCLFDVRAARALAGLGDRAAALDTFERARCAFYDGGAGGDPYVGTWLFAERTLVANEGATRAAVGDHTRALPSLEAAVEIAERQHLRWATYLHRANLLREYLNAGAHAEGERVARDIAPMVGEIASPRTEGVLTRTVRRTRRGMPTDLSDALDHIAHRLSNA